MSEAEQVINSLHWPLPPKVATAVAAVMAGVPKLGREEKNTHGSYNFASIDDFLEAIRPLCAEHGLLIIQDEEHFSIRESEGTDKFGKPTKAAWLLLSYRFTLAHTSGETWAHRPIRSIMVNASMGSQAFGAAQSYTLKQFMRSLFQVATGEKGQDADEHPPADLPARRKSSAQAKRDGDWQKLEAELLDCGSALSVDNLQRDYKAKEYTRWKQDWCDQADELFEKRRQDFGQSPGEALTLREQLEGSLEAKKDPTRHEYLAYCRDTADDMDNRDTANKWWAEQAAARKRYRLTPAEESDIRARIKASLDKLTTTFVPNARARAGAEQLPEEERHAFTQPSEPREAG